MLLGLRTAIYHAPDLEKAKAWYAEVAGVQPYFDEPFYVGFNVGGYELGLLPDATSGTPTEAVAYWGVEDADAAYARMLELGATEVSAVHDVGEGIKVGVVQDPFGNAFGIIENPHFGS